MFGGAGATAAAFQSGGLKVGPMREAGFVRTLFGRRRYLPDLGSRNRALRQAAERMAVNTVIQGTAADLIKKAMVSVDRAIESASLAATDGRRSTPR